MSTSPVRLGGHYVFFLDKEQEEFVSYVFKKMIGEFHASYQFKNDLLLNYVNLLIHEALKMTPSNSFFTPTDGSSRIAMFFNELLERQFPVNYDKKTIELKTPQDYANRLSIHVNHLNRCVKKVTGKTTSEIITNRLMVEAKTLLVHSSWNVAEISYSLGFEDPSYFAKIFKQHNGITPTAFKQ